MNTDSGRRIGRDEGQTLVFLMLVLFTLFVLAAASMTIGQAVSRRVMLQVVADAGAFTGATEMARGLNTIAELNHRIQEAWSVLTEVNLGFTMTPCPAYVASVIGYRTVRGALGTAITTVNRGYMSRAEAEARRVTRQNAGDLFPGERLRMGQQHLASGIRPQHPSGVIARLREVRDGTPSVVPALSPARRRPRYACYVPPAIVRPVRPTLPVWYELRPERRPVAFVWAVTAPARAARVFDRFFGPRLIPEMTAVALAKPVGGEVRRGEERYQAKMIPVRDLVRSVFNRQRLQWQQVRH